MIILFPNRTFDNQIVKKETQKNKKTVVWCFL